MVWQVPFLGKSLRFSASFSSVRMTSRRSAASVWSWMVKRGSTPMAAPWMRSRRAPDAWNVPPQTLWADARASLPPFGFFAGVAADGLDAMEHGLGGPAGERQQQDPIRRYALRDQVGSPVSEGERLAGAGPGDNEQGRAAVPDRLLLGGVQLPGVPGGDVADLGLGWCLLHEDGSRYSVSRGSGSGQPPGVHTRTGLRETIIEVGRFGREGRGSGDDALS